MNGTVAIRVREETLKALAHTKYDLGLRSYDEVIAFLLTRGGVQ